MHTGHVRCASHVTKAVGALHHRFPGQDIAGILPQHARAFRGQAAASGGRYLPLNSVAKLPYEYALDGISNTQTISPGALGHNDEERAQTLGQTGTYSRTHVSISEGNALSSGEALLLNGWRKGRNITSV